MYRNLDQLKLQIREQVLKFRKTVRAQCPPDEQTAFDNWFWKMVPLIQVDLIPYSNSIRVYDTTPPDEKLKVTSG